MGPLNIDFRDITTDGTWAKIFGDIDWNFRHIADLMLSITSGFAVEQFKYEVDKFNDFTLSYDLDEGSTVLVFRNDRLLGAGRKIANEYEIIDNKTLHLNYDLVDDEWIQVDYILPNFLVGLTNNFMTRFKEASDALNASIINASNMVLSIESLENYINEKIDYINLCIGDMTKLSPHATVADAYEYLLTELNKAAKALTDEQVAAINRFVNFEAATDEEVKEAMEEILSKYSTDTIETINDGITLCAQYAQDALLAKQLAQAAAGTVSGITGRVDTLETDVGDLQDDLSLLDTKVTDHENMIVASPTGVHGLRYDVALEKLEAIDSEGVWHEIKTGGSSYQFKLEPPTLGSPEEGDLEVRFVWYDPADTEIGGVPMVAWDHTIIVKKVGSAPTSYKDGTKVFDSSLGLEPDGVTPYSAGPTHPHVFVDSDVVNGLTYWYGVFPNGGEENYTTRYPDCFISLTPEETKPPKVMTFSAAPKAGSETGVVLTWSNPTVDPTLYSWYEAEYRKKGDPEWQPYT